MSDLESVRATHPGAPPFESRIHGQLALLGGWGLLWVGLQSLLEAQGVGEGPQALGLLLGHALALSALLLGARRRTLALLTDVSFAVAQGLVLALALVVGTLVLQEMESLEAYRKAYAESPALLRGTVLFLVRFLHVGDLFHSLGFYAMASLLCISAGAVAWVRRPYGLARLGFLMVHLAPALILAGGLWGRLGGERAYAELRRGEATDRFQRAGASGGELRLPFRVRLDHFAVERRAPEYRLYAYVQPDGKGGFERNPKSYAPKEGMKGVLPMSRLRFEVERLLPCGVDRGRLVEDAGAPLDPAAAVLLGTGRPEPLLGHLHARRDPGWRKDEPEGRFAVAYREAFDPADMARLKPRPPRSERLVMSFGAHRFERPVKVGDLWESPGFRLRTVALYPDFAVQHGPDGQPVATTRSREPKDPWLELRFEVPGEVPRRLLLSARDPEATDRLNAPNLPEGLTLRYERVDEERQSRFVLLTRADRSVRLVESGKLLRTEPFQPGRPFVVSPGLSVTVLELLDHPRYVPDFAPPADSVQAAAWTRPVLKVRVGDGAGRSESAWLEAGVDGAESSSAILMQGRVGLVYRPKETEPKDYRSRLSLLGPGGGVLAARAVVVNDPLVQDGWWLYQNSYRPEDGDVSGIMAVRDPGLPLVLLGFALLLVGLPWMFFLKPLLKRRAVRLGEAP